MADLTAPIPDARRSQVGGVVIDEVQAGVGRLKRVVYPPGWRWSTAMQAVTDTDRCMHAHAGFLAQGHLVAEFADGCRVDQVAPCFVVLAPGHDAWVVGDEPAVLVQYDCAGDTCSVLGLPREHTHRTG
jgi:hypothetical protein